MKSIHIFRLDHRLDDNTALIEACKNSEIVYPIFIFTPEQLTHNKYKSNNSVQFMMESLKDLNEQLNNRLYYFFGKPAKIIDELINELGINTIYFNNDYSPYSRKRDEEIREICLKNNIECHIFEDSLLHDVGSIRTGNGEIYQKFTPYFNFAKTHDIRKPIKNKHDNYFKGNIKGEYKGKLEDFYEKNDKLWVNGGRSEALKYLSKIKNMKEYNKSRNLLELETTNLSAYIKYGCLSIREIYYKFYEELGAKNDLIKQLYWRDFYHNLLWEYPQTQMKSLKEKYDKIKWKNNMTWYKKWCEGNTGFPIVDAGMRQMNETGYMHNRARLIVGNFMVKLMLIDWKKGEEYFSQKLVDIVPANNVGNWQWVAGNGADSQPYFRIFNPWTQSEKFDKNANYIKKWIPELKDIPAEDLHQWDLNHQKYQVNYPKPILDYKKQREECLKLYKKYV